MVNSRFKFRAWEKNLKEIIPVYNIDFEKRMINTDLAWRTFDEVELMQFTGLYDKHHKPIYEGDIVRFHYKTGVYKIGTVVWNDLFGSWDIDCSDFVSYKSLGQYKSVSEVIGNIFEHKHLLEGTE